MSRGHKSPKIETEFSKESKALVPVKGPSDTMLAMFNQPNERLQKAMGKANRRNLPRLLLPKEIPIGCIIDGTIKAIVDSPSAGKGVCIWLQKNGTDFLLPATGTIRQALAPGSKKGKDESESAYSKRLLELLKPDIGMHLIVKKLAPAFNKEYNKEMHQFEVFTIDESEMME